MKFRPSTIATTILTLVVTLQSGAVYASADQPTVSTSNNNVVTVTASTSRANIVYNKFLTLVKQPDKLTEANTFIKTHIYEVSSSQASLMTLRLENAQSVALRAWEEQFYVGSVQEKTATMYREHDDFTKLIHRTKDSNLRKLFQGSLDRGYKLETAEGTFFPVIDYEGYKKYRPYVMKDIKSYIDIMAVESAVIPSRDAGLMISWKEVAKRALTQESFVKSYPNSNRSKQVQSLYEQYVFNTVYGQNNTPLFEYETNTLNSEAKAAYLTLLAENTSTDSVYLKKLQAFMDVLKDNNYTLNATVEKYRKVNFPM